MSRPTLVAVAHGSRDPAAQQAVTALLDEVRSLDAGVPARAAYVQNARPSLPEVLREVGPEAGVVPLLLSGGFHASVDVAAAAAAAGVPVARPLGPGPALATAVLDRLAESGAPGDVPVVLAAAGSTDPRAVADTRAQAELVAARRSGAVVAGFVSAGSPRVLEAVTGLLRGGRPVAVAAYLLAPGQFHTTLQGLPATWVTDPLGAHPALAELVLERYRSVAAVTTRR